MSARATRPHPLVAVAEPFGGYERCDHAHNGIMFAYSLILPAMPRIVVR